MTDVQREIEPDTFYFLGQQLSISCDRRPKPLPVVSTTSTSLQLTPFNFQRKWVISAAFGSAAAFPKACLRRTTRPA